VIVCVGDCVIDVVTHVHGPVLTASDTPATIRPRLGGSATNVAVAIAHDGAESARIVAAVGDDADGRWIDCELLRRGVEPFLQYVDRPTGRIVVLVDPTGERTMLTDRSAAGALSELPVHWSDNASMVHLPLYGWWAEPTKSTCAAAVHHAHRHNIPVTIDLSSVALLRSFGSRHAVHELVRAIEPTIVLANRSEADEVALADASLGGALVAIKDGPVAAVVMRNGQVTASLQPEPLTGPLDVTGAGDAFAAGLLQAWHRGANDLELLRAAHHRAARWITDRSTPVV
jgi:sugar/nucleoside kinase (ribokinase family)